METPHSKSNLNLCRGVRVVGKIRPFLDSEASRAPHGNPSSTSTIFSEISMSRTDGEYAYVAFGDQANGRKDCYKLDWCYGQDEGVGEIFSKEVKPLLQEIMKGCNGCVIAYGAQGSGKTQLIQGSMGNPGLALMAISEILPEVEELGGSVTVSCYEVCQDRVYDLLQPREQEVLVMEDASRRIQLKGLSQVPIRSISDFKESYFHGCNEQKPSQKATNDAAVRSHRGLIIHVSYVDKESNKSHVGKMNFVDLAGYEDTKRKSFAKSTLAEVTRVNKSLYALLNVVCALNSSGTYIPYRETKLTHFLQDFLCKTSAAVLFACLNPIPCQDTIHAVCLASRSCQVVNKLRYDSAKGSKSGSRFVPSCSPLNGRIRALNASVKKLEISQVNSVENKGYGNSSAAKQRLQALSSAQKKLFGTSLHDSTGKRVNELSSSTNGRLQALSSAKKKLFGTSLHDSTGKKANELSSSANRRMQALSSAQKKLFGTSLHDSTGKKVNELSSLTNRRKMFKTKGPSINSEKEIHELGNTKDTQTSMLEVNAPISDDHNLLKANDTGSPIPKEVAFTPIENNDPGEDTDTGLVTDLKLYNENNDPREDTDIGLETDLKLYNDTHDDSKAGEKKTHVSNVGGPSPTLTEKLREISNSLRAASLSMSTPLDLSCKRQVTVDSVEPKTPKASVYLRHEGNMRFEDMDNPQSILKARNTGLKKSLVQECLSFLNHADKEELMELKGIGEKRASNIIKLREDSPEPFKKVDDLKGLGLSSKQIREMLSGLLGDF